MIITPDTRLIVTPMDPQPDWELILYGKLPKPFIDAFSPHAVGELIPLREEWRIKTYRKEYFLVCIEIEFRDGSTKLTIEPYRDVIAFDDGWEPKDWQPASTMPDFAVRHWLRVTKVEVKNMYCERCEGKPLLEAGYTHYFDGPEHHFIDPCPDCGWKWLTHVERKEESDEEIHIQVS